MLKYLRDKFIGVSDDALVEAEIELLEQSGLDLNQVRINDVRIELDPSQKFVETKNGDDLYIHTVSIKADQ